jgi:hypothetical protein
MNGPFWYQGAPGAKWHVFTKHYLETGDAALCTKFEFQGKRASATPHMDMKLGPGQERCEDCYSRAFGERGIKQTR